MKLKLKVSPTAPTPDIDVAEPVVASIEFFVPPKFVLKEPFSSPVNHSISDASSVFVVATSSSSPSFDGADPLY